jgi:hypothetical protein
MWPDDPVNKPAHYTAGSIECIDAIQTALGNEAFVAYCRGNAIKYLWRTGRKGPGPQDLLKAAWYCQRAATVVEEMAYTKPPTLDTNRYD